MNQTPLTGFIELSCSKLATTLLTLKFTEIIFSVFRQLLNKLTQSCFSILELHTISHYLLIEDAVTMRNGSNFQTSDWSVCSEPVLLSVYKLRVREPWPQLLTTT